MTEPCTWPNGTCQCYIQEQSKPDPWGRVWMLCESGLTMSKTSLANLMTFCLKNRVKIGDIDAFQPNYPRSLVMVSVKLKPEQFEAFEKETGGKLREPYKINLN